MHFYRLNVETFLIIVANIVAKERDPLTAIKNNPTTFKDSQGRTKRITKI